MAHATILAMATQDPLVAAPPAPADHRRPWSWLVAGVVLGAALTFVTLRVLQEMINEPPVDARPGR